MNPRAESRRLHVNHQETAMIRISNTTSLIQTITQGGVTLTYTYDDNGNIVSVSDGVKTTGYVYRPLGRGSDH